MKKVLLLIALTLVVSIDPLWGDTTKTPADKLTITEAVKKAQDKHAIESSQSRESQKTSTAEEKAAEAKEWFTKGYNASRAEKYDEAINYYKKAIGINPDYADAHANLGVTYMNKGRLEEAIVAFKKAITLDPQNTGAHYNLGLVYDKKGKIDEAISAYEKSIAINPRFARAYQNLGIAYFEKDLTSMAAECFYKAAVLFNEKGETRSALESYDALTLTESKELEQALAEKLFPEQHQKETGAAE